jgi:hypothetical protein
MDDPNELVSRHVVTQQRLVADHDGIDVAVAARERDRGLDFALVAFLVAFDLPPVAPDAGARLLGDAAEPDTDRDLEAEFRGDAGDQLLPASGGVRADRAGVGTQELEVAADLFRSRPIAVIRVLPSCVW